VVLAARVPLLADRYRLVMPDLRGHGWTEAPQDGYDKEQLATDLLGLLDALELPQVGLVGHDWGAWTGFLAALRAPERFRAFLALGIVHPFQRPTIGRALQSWRFAYQVGLSTPVLPELLLRSSPQLVEAVIAAGSSRPDAFADGQAGRTARSCRTRHGRGRACCSTARWSCARGCRSRSAATAGGRCTCRPASSSGPATRSPARRCSRARPAPRRRGAAGRRPLRPGGGPQVVAERVRALFG
jgi:pimeloyl-ACP methyl ester carboxylesterase